MTTLTLVLPVVQLTVSLLRYRCNGDVVNTMTYEREEKNSQAPLSRRPDDVLSKHVV